jgi:hypothetical protein
MKRLSLLAILPVLLLLAPAGPAHAASLLDDCQDGRIDGTYTQEQFRRGLRQVAADVDQYTDCSRVIRRAQLAAAVGGARGGQDAGTAAGGSGAAGAGAAGGSGGAAGGGTSTEAPTSALRADPLASATPEERRAVEQATTGGAGPVRLGAIAVRPGATGLDAAAGDIPGPLLALLALLAVAGLGYGAAVTRARVIARRAG